MITTETIYSYGGSYTPTAASCAAGAGAHPNQITGGYSCPASYSDFVISGLTGGGTCMLHTCYATTTPLSSTTAFAIQLNQGTTTIPVDNAVFDLFAGYTICLMMIAGVIWFFRRK